MMILVIDNYDSFTFNLVQLFGRVTEEIEVRRNDQLSTKEVRRMGPSGIVISPGPGRPEDAGVTVETIRSLGPEIPVLGVCLGHQAIGHAFGGKVTYAPSLMHGRTSHVNHQGTSLFRGLQNPFVATRYHSLVISAEDFPEELEVTATADDGVIMGVKHKRYPIEGVQFHPESILTTEGEKIVRNWMEEFHVD
jgi:anthranilate synthase/aminodeoxychorismate synthase-like glutamine amidotransferase